jgi:Xaa-Pro aminopeptidase
MESNPIDGLWSDRPEPPSGAVTLHDFRYAGEYANSKLTRIRAEIATARADALVISDPHSLAWTFNIRGADVAHSPIQRQHSAWCGVPQSASAVANSSAHTSSIERVPVK